MAKSGALSDLEPREYEVRLRRSDGVFRWFLFRIELLRDEVSEVVRWYGTATDIEDRKRSKRCVLPKSALWRWSPMARA